MRRGFILTAVLAGIALLVLTTRTFSDLTLASDMSRATIEPALTIRQHSTPSGFVRSGARLTYTLEVIGNSYDVIPIILTDTLPLHVFTDETLAGTTILPGGQLVWTPVIPQDGAWSQQVVVTVETGYVGWLTNTLELNNGLVHYAVSTHTIRAVEEVYQLSLPLVIRSYQASGVNLLVNPGFEGIGLPVDNNHPNYGNWTRDTFTGQQYGEIFTPEGWVTWWEEGDYGRPECKVIPNEHPFNSDPTRIYQGYYAGMCFTFFRKQHAGYYQVVSNLEPGATVEGWFYAHAWSCSEDEPPVSCGDPFAFYFQVGLEPDGGTDPFSDTILWSEPKYIYDVYQPTNLVTATVGAAGQVTFYLRAHAKWAVKHNVAYWDNPTLVYIRP